MITKGLNILIVEDKTILAEDLSMQLQALGYNILAIFPDGESALESFMRLKPDLVLMDIRLAGEIDGIQAAHEINKMLRTPIIYITAHSDKTTIERASQTFPFAFIVKPFDSRELEISIDLAINNFSHYRDDENDEVLEELSGEFIIEDSIFVKKNACYERVRLNDILFAEAAGSYTQFKTADFSYTLSMNLHTFAERINVNHIVRVHRSYLVNLNKIEKIEGHQLTVASNKIPISKSYKEQLNQRFRMI